MFTKFWEKIQKMALKIIAERLNRDVETYQLRRPNKIERLKQILQPGDVILVEGKKLVSRVIMAVTNSTWSHSALYVGDGKMIDPLPDTGTVVNGIDHYEHLNIRVCRPMGLSEEQLIKVCNFAVSHVGRGYDQINIANLLFGFFKKKKDKTEFIGDISSSNEVCSGLIAESYNHVGFVIQDSVNFSQIVPADFDLSPYFEIVKFNYNRSQDVAAREVASEWLGSKRKTGSKT